MEDNIFSHPDIPLILEYRDNNICADCEEKKNIFWCSINNGVFLCVKCARNHKKILKNFSIIKSLEADLFSEYEINLLKKGGNMRFNNLMIEYNIPITQDTKEYKYQTIVSDYYRKLLHSEVKGININIAKPSLEKGLLKITNEMIYENLNYNNIPQKDYREVNNNYNNSNYNNVSNYNNQNNYNINNMNNNWFSSMEQMFNNLGDQIYNTFKDYQIDEKIQKANEYINDKTEQITNSELFQNMKNKAENGIQIIKAKASELYNINEQYNDLDNKKSSDIVEMSDIELQNEKNNNNNNEISNKENINENKNIINNNEENSISNEKENILNDDKKNILSNDKENNINNEK